MIFKQKVGYLGFAIEKQEFALSGFYTDRPTVWL